MKRWITLLTVLLLIASLSVTAFAANADEEYTARSAVQIDDHVHNWGSWQETAAPTCDQEGREVRSCDCGEEESHAINKLPHSWGPWQEIAAPTCEAEGQQFHTCTVCGEEETGAIATLPHSWGPWQEIAAPTCEAEGQQFHGCTACGEEETGAIDKLAHSWSAWKTVKEANCTEKGSESHVCTVCQTEETRDTPIRHNWAPGKELKAPTCTQAGIDERTCTRCDAKEPVILKPEGHKAGEAVLENEDAVRCTQESIHDAVVSCTVCGVELSRETVTLPPAGHSWGDWTVVTDATCTEVGEEAHTCTACGETEHREVATKDHTWQYTPAEFGHISTCSVCGATESSAVHVYDVNGVCLCGQEIPEEKTLLSGNSMVKIAVAAAAAATLVGGILLLVMKAKGIQ